MSEAVAEILSRIDHLSQGERAELAYALLLSLEPDQPPEPDAAFESDLARRVAEIREGRAKGKPAEQVFAELRARRK
jgi:putative addiction module component (TIGR02574 family)